MNQSHLSKTWLLLVAAILVTAGGFYALVRLSQIRTPQEKLPFGAPYVSPDGKWAVVRDFQRGGVWLYSIAQRRVIKRFPAEEYMVPILGRIWSKDSNYFLLIRHPLWGGTIYEVHSVKTGRVRRLKVQGRQGLRASLSPNGRVVVAEVGNDDQGTSELLVWDTKDVLRQRFKELGYESVYGLTWIGDSKLLVKIGVQNPRLYLWNMDTGVYRFLDVPISGSIRLSFQSSSNHEVPLVLVKDKTQEVLALLDLRNQRVEPVEVLSGTGWQWLSGSQVLWRWVASGVVEVARYDALQRRLERPLRLKVSAMPGVDNSGRIWVLEDEVIRQSGRFEDSP